MKFAEKMKGIVMGKLLVTLLPADGITKAIYAGGHYVREHQQRRRKMKFAEEMKGIVMGKLLVTLATFGNPNNGGKFLGTPTTAKKNEIR